MPLNFVIARPILEGAERLESASRDFATELGLSAGFQTLHFNDEPRISFVRVKSDLSRALSDESDRIHDAMQVGIGSEDVALKDLITIASRFPLQASSLWVKPKSKYSDKPPGIVLGQELNEDSVANCPLLPDELVRIVLEIAARNWTKKDGKPFMRDLFNIYGGVINSLPFVRPNLNAIIPSQSWIEGRIASSGISFPEVTLGKAIISVEERGRPATAKYGFLE
jgi:hypothetical protein